MLRKALGLLEDSLYPSVGPHIKLLKLTGLWHPSLDTRMSRLKQYLFYFIVAFFFSQYLKCLYMFDADSLKLILQYAPFHMGIVKSSFFQKDYSDWERLIQYMSITEQKQLALKDLKQNKIIQEYIKKNRRMTYFFWALAFFSNFFIFSEPYQKNQVTVNGTSVYLPIFDGYTPFSKEPPGYYISMTLQTILGHIVSVYVVGWDTLVVSIMIFFAGQLKIARLYNNSVVDLSDLKKSQKRIAVFHRFYIELVGFQKMFNSLISPVMFVYLVIISINLGVCIIQIVQIQDDLPTLVSSCVFVAACLIQLLLFYWFSNEVTLESTLVSYSTFESQWPSGSKKIQKQVLLLGITTSKRLVFNAGPFNQMSLATFLSILRASYSFYTLMSKAN